MDSRAWSDEDNNLYHAHHLGKHVSVSVFDVADALQSEAQEAELAPPGPIDILNGMRFVYVSPEVMDKERWDPEDMREKPTLGDWAVGIIECEPAK